jgi:hypothetical protein
MNLITLRALLEETKQVMDSRVTKTEEGRYLFALHARLLEALINDRVTTELPAKHHA